jgi:fumarate hydratase, class I
MADAFSLFSLGPDVTPYRLLTKEHVDVSVFRGRDTLIVQPEALRLLAEQAFIDMNHFLRPGHLAQVRHILDDPEASANDRFVALDLLKNASIASGGVLPMCQDTGTAIIMGKRGLRVWTEGGDEAALAEGTADAYRKRNLRYSQVAPLSMYEERNTRTNLPAQIELMAEGEDEYKFLFMAKGGGSANKSLLFQAPPSVLAPDRLIAYLEDKIGSLGTSACPPYHLAVVIGGLSAEQTLKTAKLASARYLDGLPTLGDESGRAYRDTDMEVALHKVSQSLGIGAQFGGKYFCHDVRVIRMPRHGASLPIGIAVSCSADRQALGKITREGVFLEQLETDPARFLPEAAAVDLSSEAVRIDLNQPMAAIRAALSQCPIRTRLSLSGVLIVARDAAHTRLRQALQRGEGLPDYFKNHPVYYAGPAKTPPGLASGAFGPTTAGRMDGFVDEFQAAGGSLVMLAKGNRASIVRDACKRHGGFYLGSIGGSAARLGQDCIRKVECLAFADLGMEAVWRIEVEDFPAFMVIDDKGNDFFEKLK